MGEVGPWVWGKGFLLVNKVNKKYVQLCFCYKLDKLSSVQILN